MPGDLTEKQQKALPEQVGSPVEIADPQTRQAYVLLAREQYDRVRSLVAGDFP